MNKKQRILNHLKSKNWHNDSTWFNKNDFEELDLDSSYEYGDKYNDIIYARNILQKEGYRPF